MIVKMLRNEKYKGDLLLQKTFVPDFRNKKRYENKGSVRQYLVEDAHEAIISRKVFDQVQKEIARREREVLPKKDYSEKLFGNLIVCGCCDCHYGRNRNRTAKGKPYIWRCNKYAVGSRSACPSKSILESVLIRKTKDVLKISEKEELTRDILEEQIEYIEVMSEQKLRFFLKNGRVETVEWKNPSRSKSWTPEMREKARQKTLARVKAQRAVA